MKTTQPHVELLRRAADAIDAMLEWLPCECSDDGVCQACLDTYKYLDTLECIEHWLEMEEGP